MDDALNNVILLTSSNWELRKIEIKVILMHFGAWKFMESPEAETEGKLTWREHEDLRLRKDGAYTIIYQSPSKEYRPLISSTTDGAVAWKILYDHFEPTTHARIIQLLDDFFWNKICIRRKSWTFPVSCEASCTTFK